MRILEAVPSIIQGIMKYMHHWKFYSEEIDH
jgi:hypothetical protein